MKKFFKWFIIIIAVVIAIAAIANGNADSQKDNENKTKIENDLKFSRVYPFYNSLNQSEKQLYVDICNAIENHSSAEIAVGEYSSYSALLAAEKDFGNFLLDILFEQPQYFWVSAYEYEYLTREANNKHKLSVKLKFIMTKEEAEGKKSYFDNTVISIVNEAKKQDGLFNKVLYVYDYIMDNTIYDYDLSESEDANDVNRTAYGCLMNGRTVCTGYTLAFNLIMQKLNIECGAEFNSYSDISFAERHVWNYCKLDDEYYYFDLTWDDTGYDSDSYKDYIKYGHTYFAITTEELEQSHFRAPEAKTPDCNGTKYNYYIYNNLNISEYTYDVAKEIIEKQLGNKFIEMRFDSYAELLKAKSELIEDSKIFSLLENAERITYSITKDDMHLYIFPREYDK